MNNGLAQFVQDLRVSGQRIVVIEGVVNQSLPNVAFRNGNRHCPLDYTGVEISK